MDRCIKLLLILILLTDVTADDENDPCNDYLTLEEVLRSAGYSLNLESDIAISDDRLSPGWYRIVSNAGEEMPTEPPGQFRCKTWYPIWLNGILPTDIGTQVVQPVCIQSFTSDCEHTWDITIRRCDGNYLVYELSSSPLAKSAYCFGTHVKCPDGQYSETGYSPGCSTDFPSDMFTPVVTAELAEGPIKSNAIGPSLEPVFRCSFANVIGQSYAYDIYWYINEQSVITHKRIPYENINQTLLRPADWVGTYQMNMVVKCAMRARLNVSSIPGPYHNSEDFAAGIKPEHTVYELLEGEEKNITVTTTVPVGCVGSIDAFKRQCTHTLKVSQPVYQGDPISHCLNNIQQESLLFETQNCGVTFSTVNWKNPVDLTVKGYVDNVYNANERTGYIRLKTDKPSSTDESGVWDIVNIPDIQLVITDHDSAVTSRSCQTWNDPRYRTADGKRFNHHASGEYIFYRHKKFPYWVHTLTTACPQGTCNCGVAVRSHDSLFVVRTCDVISNSFYASGRYYPSISYAVCDNKNMVIEKTSDGYKVTLPIGTVITFRISGSWIPTVTLKPSALDIGQTEGLCGFISETRDQSDDFMARDSTTPSASASDFAFSWRVEQGTVEELFAPNPRLPTQQLYLKEYCRCALEADHKSDISDFTDLHCNLTEPMIPCISTRTPLASSLYQECHKNRKRDLSDSDDVTVEIPLSYDPDYDPTYLQPDPEWRNNWTEERAKQACIDGIYQMAALELCKTYAQLDVNFYIESCVDDVKQAGSIEYLPYTIALMEDACKLEISRNESLFNSSSNNGPSILEMIENYLCPSNCSNNGKCNRTECVCNSGFVGSDCSVTLSAAPKNITIPDSGLCNTRTRSCSKTNVFGVFHSETVYCKFKYFTPTENGPQFSGRETIVTAVYHYEYMVSCNFPDSRKKRSTDTTAEGYEISLSYDRTNYGDSFSFLIFDENCMACNTSAMSCSELDSCSHELEDTGESDSKSGLSSTLIGAIVGICAAILVVVIILLWCKYKKPKNIQSEMKPQSQGVVNDSYDVLTNYDFTSGQSPPMYTELRRESTDLSIGWVTDRPRTPVDLFYVQGN